MLTAALLGSILNHETARIKDRRSLDLLIYCIGCMWVRNAGIDIAFQNSNLVRQATPVVLAFLLLSVQRAALPA